LEGFLSLELYYTVSFHSIRQSRVTEGVDADELWSLSHVTQVVDEYIFGHGWPGKWLQNRIESGKNNPVGSEVVNLVFKPIFLAQNKFPARI
jgi:hypothetical protein